MMQGSPVIRKQLETGKLGSTLPIVGWFHFPLADPVADDFYNETVQTANDYDWDLVKIMTCGNYMPLAYGADYEFSVSPEKWDGFFSSHPITCAADAAALKPLVVAENKVLSDEVAVDARIVKRYKGTRPVLATLFDPLSWIQELTTPMHPAFTLDLLRSNPNEVLHALDALQETNNAFLDALINEAHIDGIFLATKFSTSTLLTPEEHRTFVLPYLEETARQLEGRTWINMLHVHGDTGLYFDDLLELGYQAYNWECIGTAPGISSIADVRSKTDKMLITGFDQNRDFMGTPAQVKERLKVRLFDSLAQNDGGQFVFGPGCTLPLTVNRELFTLVHEVVEEAGLR